MGDDITIGVTEIVNNIEVTAQPNDQIVDISVIDNADEVTLNITPTVIEINVNKGSSYARWGTIYGNLTDQTDLTNALILKADLVDGKVPAYQLPSYVDDVIEVANYAALPIAGETGKLYVTLDTNHIYRWTGSTYVEITDNTAVWGAITGTLSSQTDLQTALDTKALKTTTISTSAPLSGGGDLSTNRTLSISQSGASTDGYLSSTDWNKFNNNIPAGTPNIGDYVFYNGSNLAYRTFLTTSPLSFSVSTGTFSISQSNTSSNGYLSSTDWNTFNGKQAALNGTGFVKISGTTISYDNSTYALDSVVVKLTGDQTIAGAKTFSSNVTAPVFQLQPNNTVGSNPNYIGQQMATNDSWKIYGNTADLDKGEMVFELGDNAIPFGDSNGQRFRFHYDNSSNGTGKSPFILDYNEATFNANVTATSFIKSGGTSSQFLKANGSVDSSTYVPTSRTITINGTSYDLSSDRSWTISAGISGSGTTNYISKFTSSTSIGNSVIYDNGTNVGIGTANPGAPLSFEDSFALKIQLNGNSSNYYGISKLAGGGNLQDGEFRFTSGNTYAGGFTFSSQGTERMRITSSGNVGIGNGANVNARLHVEGQDIYLTGNTDNRIRFSNYGFTGNSMGAAIGYVYGTANTQEQGNLAFYTNPNFNGTGSLTERMRITSSGNVGVFNTLYGVNNVRSDGAYGGIDFYNSGIGYQYSAKIYTLKNSTEFYGLTNDFGAGTSGQLSIVAKGDATSNIGIYTNANERIRVTGGGDVLIGTQTNPGSGNYKAAIVTGGYDGLYISVNQSPGGHALRANRNGDGDLILFSRNGTNVGAIAVSSGGTGYYTSSDYRLKQDFKPFKGLDLISKIKVYDYEWKSNKTRSYGVIAHELQQVINYVVTGNKDDEEMQSVDYSKIVPILIASIQELKVEIENLKYKI